MKLLTLTFAGVLPEGRHAGATLGMAGRLNPFCICNKAKSQLTFRQLGCSIFLELFMITLIHNKKEYNKSTDVYLETWEQQLPGLRRSNRPTQQYMLLALFLLIDKRYIGQRRMNYNMAFFTVDINYPSVQCAAVRTQSELINVPPQN